MGFFLLMAAGNDSHQGRRSRSGMRALIENPEQLRNGCSTTRG